ncbi:HAD-IA family hydrolase [Iocasia frigidifontis]|uniref:HAD-IA family hydrolase n=1 Tax=Iocasia fonsfrigidae TaxID=2682810 RepID=A0A8A7KKJ1_9FIRM|nr:HAD family hydrolase [Iocasia fonsfrigidae]QTL98614.1 HAD-IA family hydrolase [Iocasia fonsfrigidae]
MRYDAIIFDFDYTLADSSKGTVECINYALDNMKLSCVPFEDASNTIGLSLKDTFISLTDKKYHSHDNFYLFSELFVKRADEVMAEMTFLFEPIKNEIEKLKDKGFMLGIVSTKFRYRIENILKRDGLIGYFDIIIGGEDVKENKPSPDGLLSAIKKLKKNKEDILYVGDSMTDLKTAKNAGVDFVAVTTGTTTKSKFEKNGVKKIVDNIVKLDNYVG